MKDTASVSDLELKRAIRAFDPSRPIRNDQDDALEMAVLAYHEDMLYGLCMFGEVPELQETKAFIRGRIKALELKRQQWDTRFLDSSIRRHAPLLWPAARGAERKIDAQWLGQTGIDPDLSIS